MTDLHYVGGGARTSPSQLQAYAARSLHLLRDIEQTLLALDTECKALEVFSVDAERLLEALKDVQLKSVLDPDRRTVLLFSQAQDTAQRVYESAARQRASAAADARLCEEDGIVEAYDCFLHELTRYHDLLGALGERIAVHDALLSPRGEKVYGEADDMMAEILAGR